MPGLVGRAQARDRLGFLAPWTARWSGCGAIAPLYGAQAHLRVLEAKHDDPRCATLVA